MILLSETKVKANTLYHFNFTWTLTDDTNCTKKTVTCCTCSSLRHMSSHTYHACHIPHSLLHSRTLCIALLLHFKETVLWDQSKRSSSMHEHTRHTQNMSIFKFPTRHIHYSSSTVWFSDHLCFLPSSDIIVTVSLCSRKSANTLEGEMFTQLIEMLDKTTKIRPNF